MASTLSIDKAYGAFWNIPGIKPFKLENAMSGREALVAGELDWCIEQRPIMALDAQGCEIAIESHVANVRGDTQQCIGVVGSKYQPLDNEEFFDLAQLVIRESDAHFVAAGFTHGGSRVHAVMALDKVFDLGMEGEDILPLMFLSNGHDGGLAVRLRVSPMRLACANGMLVRTKVRHDWSTRHTSGIGARVEDARRALSIVQPYLESVEGQAKDLLARPMGARPFNRFLSQLVPLPQGILVSDQTLHDRRVKRVETVRAALRAQRDSPDLASIRETAYGALQAVTAYVTHDAPRHGEAARFRALSEEHRLVREATRLLARA